MSYHTIEPFKLIGIRLETKTTNQQRQSSPDCEALWDRFERENLIDRIPDKLSDRVFAVYHDYDQDDPDSFNYFLGCKVNSQASPPDGFTAIEVPAGRYQVTIAHGRMPYCTAQIWQEIEKLDMNRNFGVDFEVYADESTNRHDAEVPVFVSVH
jgi:predicted transcriptional regulator YdeE